MQHTIVSRLVAALCALFGAAALLFAWHASSGAPSAGSTTPPSSSPPSNGEALFAARCASCHTLVDASSRVAPLLASGSKALDTLDFLDAHTPATPNENRAILAWLLARESR